MLRLAADENFNHDIVRGLLRRQAALDLVSIQLAGLSGAVDPEVLAWAASEQRVLLTHDVATIPYHAYQRVGAGQAMSGVFVVSHDVSIVTAIDDLLLLAECSLPGEWNDRVVYLPLR